MKIRIKGNSVRYRLTRSEIARFAEQGRLDEQTEMVGGTLHYSLQATTAEEGLSASYADGTIVLHVPQSIANEWTSTDIVGFENRRKLENGHELFLLIEKDFVCLDHTNEDQSDNYPNPNLVC